MHKCISWDIFAFGHHWWNLNPVRNLTTFIVGNGLDFSCKLAFCTLCHSCYLWFHFVKVGPSCVGLQLKSNLQMQFMDFSTIWSNVSTEALGNNSNSNSVLTPISLRSLVRSSLSCFLLLHNVNKDYYPKTWLTDCAKKETCASLVADLVRELAQDPVEVLSLGFYIPSTSSKFWSIIYDFPPESALEELDEL